VRSVRDDDDGEVIVLRTSILHDSSAVEDGTLLGTKVKHLQCLREFSKVLEHTDMV
jgi:hypothetical protein